MQREADRVIGRRVAGMQRRYHVGAALGQHRARDLARHEAHAVEMTFGSELCALLHQLAAYVDADDAAMCGRPDHQVVEDEAQVGFTGAEIGDHGVLVFGQQPVERRAQQRHQVQHLLQLRRESVFSAPSRVRMCSAFKSAIELV